MAPTFKNILTLVTLTVLGYFSWLMLKIVCMYIPIRMDVAFLLLKQEYIHIDLWRIAFFTHVFTSMFVLVAGFTQFLKPLLKAYPRWHRGLGYLYVIDILFVTGPAGLIMSFYANGGMWSRVAFILLSVLWIGFTAMALYHAKKKDFVQHRIFMIRSYALTLSALSLRAWKVLLATFTDMGPMDRYRLIAWLGWGLNLVIAEYIIRRYVQKSRFSLV